MNKKNYVSQLIKDEKIDICCLQEIDLKPNIDKNLLSFGGYSLEIESNDVKARAGIYVKNGIEYIRRNELEGLNNSWLNKSIDSFKILCKLTFLT